MAIPRPGKVPLKRLKRLNGPVYLHASLDGERVTMSACIMAEMRGATRRAVSYALSSPWVLWYVAGRGGELAGVEAGEVGFRCHCDEAVVGC